MVVTSMYFKKYKFNISMAQKQCVSETYKRYILQVHNFSYYKRKKGSN